MKQRILPYLPGVALFVIAVVITFLTYKDYGISWDEPFQHNTGRITYEYVTNGDQTLFTYMDRNYGTGFELPLMFLEKKMKLTDTRDIYLMRHLCTHLFFLVAALAAYVLIYRLYRKWIIATIGFLMLAFEPRIYAHSFFNTKDIPFLCMFIITLAVCQLAFDRRKTWQFVLLGVVTGYATSIRVMGIMLVAFMLALFFADYLKDRKDKALAKKTLINAGLFFLTFCLGLYAAWPFLWKSPLGNFADSYAQMSHYNWAGNVLIQGKYVPAMELEWTYFPIWFFISNPILWLFAGFAGMIMVVRDFFGKSKTFFQNSLERNAMLHLFCFSIPVLAVIKLHSVIYDDWRHLYFVYPSFVLLAAYCLNKLYESKFKWAIVGACGLQFVLVAWFMVSNHPYQEVYFNEFVSRTDESLRENYELDYWGPCFKQGLEHLLAVDKSSVIKISTNFPDPVKNNILILPPADQKRFEFVEQPQADYFITNFRGHPDDYPSNNIEYNVKVLNSSILRIYWLKTKPGK